MGELAKQRRRTPLEAVFSFFTNLTGRGRVRSAPPTQTIGVPGTAIFGGYIVEVDTDPKLTGREKYRTYSRILANTNVVSASVYYFLNLIAKASWSFKAADHPQGEELAEMCEAILMRDPETSWARIVRRAAMYRFYGFSIQEWTARRRDDGVITFADIAPRAQITIERWDANTDGSINGVVQRAPQDQLELYIPRTKLLYMVDDSLNDSPEGLGLFRHLASASARLLRYEQLEGFGYETDLRGVPIGRIPYAELREQVRSNQITAAEFQQAVAPVEGFVKNHIKQPELGLTVDSSTYTTTDEEGRPSAERKYDVELLEGSQDGLEDIASAIERLNREMARILGTEAILLGEGDAGSHALSRDKTQQLSLTIDATLAELAEQFEKDLLRPIFRLNGWPEEAMPEMKPEAVQYRDVEQIARAIRDVASAGVMLDPADETVKELFGLLGLTPPNDLLRAQDASLLGGDPAATARNAPEPDELPERTSEEEEAAA